MPSTTPSPCENWRDVLLIDVSQLSTSIVVMIYVVIAISVSRAPETIAECSYYPNAANINDCLYSFAVS